MPAGALAGALGDFDLLLALAFLLMLNGLGYFAYRSLCRRKLGRTVGESSMGIARDGERTWVADGAPSERVAVLVVVVPIFGPVLLMLPAALALALWLWTLAPGI
jgi:hypothetical protein